MDDGMPKRAEKRHYQRIAAELPVRIEYGGKTVEATTENISCGGMFLGGLNRELNPDDTVTAFVTLPEDCKVVKLSGRVCRVQPTADSAVQGIAVQFRGLYDENRLEIDRYVKWRLLN